MTPIPDAVAGPPYQSDEEPYDAEAALVLAIQNGIIEAMLVRDFAVWDWLWKVVEECY
jgi:hypothetical protein